MIIEQASEIKAMRVLAKYWYKEFSAYSLAEEAGITAPMAYKAIEKLAAKKMAIKEGSRIRIDFNSQLSYTFKLFYDAERLSELPEDIQYKIGSIFNILKSEYKYGLLGFIVFGSTASGETTEQSDLDILSIVKEKKEIDYRKKGLLNMGRINILEKQADEFENEYLLAHDLILNALMRGIIVFDGGIIRFLMEKPLPQPSDEIITQKRERLEKLRSRLFISLKDKDYKELTEQFKQYIIEKGRVLMLQKRIVPSSKEHIVSFLKKEEKGLHNLYKTADKKNIKRMVEENA